MLPTRALPGIVVALALAPAAAAQRGDVDVRLFGSLEEAGLAEPVLGIDLYPGLRPEDVTRPDLTGESGVLPAIMLTGYWPPTNEMIRRFSTDPVKNPEGWIGGNWEGRGYDVHAFFPEFANPNCQSCGKGTGEMEVDYQDTSTDFWAFANTLQPIAVITFSRGFNNLSWEVEMNQFNRTVWVNDYQAPFQPTPAPPDAGWPADGLRISQQPVQDIVDAIAAAGLGLSPQICFTGDGGGFLSEFAAYHGVWYQNLHADPTDPAWCVTGGHVHVGGQISWGTARLAAEETVRTVIDFIDPIVVPVAYSTPKTSSAGCVTLIGTTDATPTSGALDAFVVAGHVQDLKNGLLFGGISGPASIPFGGGTLAVQPPLFRTAVQNAGGTDPSYCNGAYQYLVNTGYVIPQGSDAGPGNSAWYQWWYRDPDNGAGNFGTALSNGVRLDFQ